MKTIEALRRVDRSAKNHTDPDVDGFCEELGVPGYFGWSEEFNEKVKGYWLTKWYCTDTWVGTVVYYMDGEPVAVSHQEARKSSPEYQFVSEEAASKIRELLFSLLTEEAPTYEIVDLDLEIPETYTVEFNSQLLAKEGFYEGQPCWVTVVEGGMLAKRITVRFEDGSAKLINVNEFQIPLSLADEVAS